MVFQIGLLLCKNLSEYLLGRVAGGGKHSSEVEPLNVDVVVVSKKCQARSADRNFEFTQRAPTWVPIHPFIFNTQLNAPKRQKTTVPLLASHFLLNCQNTFFISFLFHSRRNKISFAYVQLAKRPAPSFHARPPTDPLHLFLLMVYKDWSSITCRYFFSSLFSFSVAGGKS